MSASDVEEADMVRQLAMERSEIIRGLVPKYCRYNAWDINSNHLPNTADWMERADPLPRPSDDKLADPIINRTICENPHLFKVSTPINVDLFKSLLVTHPNQPFVRSVVIRLREGFWPCADTAQDDYPTTHNNHRATTKDPVKAKFLEEQFRIEVEKGCFSQPFGPDLLPGMYSMPVHAVPKDNGAMFRMVTDHSAKPFPLNGMTRPPCLPHLSTTCVM